MIIFLLRLTLEQTLPLRKKLNCLVPNENQTKNIFAQLHKSLHISNKKNVLHIVLPFSTFSFRKKKEFGYFFYAFFHNDSRKKVECLSSGLVMLVLGMISMSVARV
jgi:hypothetical protein